MNFKRQLSCALADTSFPMCKYPVLSERPTLNPSGTYRVIFEMQQRGWQVVMRPGQNSPWFQSVKSVVGKKGYKSPPFISVGLILYLNNCGPV